MLLVAVNKIVASLLLDTKVYMLPKYRQYVAGNEQHVAGQHVARFSDLVIADFCAPYKLLYY